jgi:carbamoyl-phosphate synthase large subunit
LLGLAREIEATWLVPTVAEELVPLARAARCFRARSIAVYIPAPLATEACCDKWRSATELARLGIAAPRSAMGRADDAEVQALGFPRLSKPRFGRGGRGVVVHDGPGIPPAQDCSIWQDFLPGAEYDVIAVRRPGEDESMVAGVFEKTALREGRVGNGTAVRKTGHAGVEALARRAISRLDLSGPVDIDVRCDGRGRPHVIEINPRVGAHILAFEPAIDALVALHREGVL